MVYRDAQTAYRALVAIAQTQGGYFSAKQAQRAGFQASHLSYHLRAGNITRAGHGLYRLPEIPVSEHDQLIRLTLASRNRGERPQAVVSHASALVLHQLSDTLPVSVHLTVPPSWRRPTPPGVVLHRRVLSVQDAEEWEGFRVTTPLRTLLDVALDGRPGREQLGRAVQDALSRGLVRRSEIRAALATLPDSASRTRLAAALPRRR
jgi:predicted transcriptional regulator of viral defense system